MGRPAVFSGSNVPQPVTNERETKIPIRMSWLFKILFKVIAIALWSNGLLIRNLDLRRRECANKDQHQRSPVVIVQSPSFLIDFGQFHGVQYSRSDEFRQYRS